MNRWRTILAAGGGLALLAVMWLGLSAETGVPASTSAGQPAAGESSTQVFTDTVMLAPAKDNTLYESEIGAVSNGAGEFLFAGVTQNSDARRAVLAFDLRGIPPWATVHAATLTLTMSKTIAGPSVVSLHRLLADWGEGASDAVGEEGGGALAQPGDATWIYTFFDTDEWATPGGDFVAAPAATTMVGGFGLYSWSSAGLLADVAGWAAGPAANFGWALLGDESGPGTAKRFNSRENATGGPRLTITYSFAGDRAYLPVILR
jgi:hypothetical protein